MRTPHALLGLALSACALAAAVQEPAPRPDAPAKEEPLAVGDEAPAFTLNDQAGKLASIGGEGEQWTVLAFYPKALTGG